MDIETLEQQAQAAQTAFTAKEDIDIVPSTNPSMETLKQIQGAEIPLWESAKAGFRSTFVHDVWDAGLVHGIPEDPNFNVKDHPDLISGINVEDQKSILNADSREAALEIKSQIIQEYQDREIFQYQGVSGTVAAGLAGILDADAPLTFLAPEFTLASKIKGAGKLAHIGRLAVGGAEASAALTAASVMTGPTGEWRDVVDAGIGGLWFGATMGVITPKGLTHHIDPDAELAKAHQTFHEHYDPAGDPKMAGAVPPQPDRTPDIQAKMQMDTSVGAASLRESNYNPDLADPDTTKLRDEARAKLGMAGVGESIEDAFPDNKAGRAAREFSKVWDKLPISGFWAKAMNSGSFILKADAYDLLESPAGIARNNTTAAVLRKVYNTQVMAPVALAYEDALGSWIRETGRLTQGFAGLSKYNPAVRDEFNKLVRIERAMRENTGVGAPNVHKAVKQVADAMDEAAHTARKVLRGAEGEHPVKGSENLQDRPGYFPQIVSGDLIIKAVHSGKASLDNITQAFKSALRQVHADWSDEVVDKLAKAQVRRGIHAASNSDTNLYRMLDEEGVIFTKQYLKDVGLTQAEADAALEGLKKLKPETEKTGFLRHRTEMDILTPIPGTDGMMLIDLMHNDIPEVWSQYARRVSGSAALARKGIQYADRAARIESIKAEIRATKGAAEINMEDVENMYSMFGGGPIAGGLDSWTRRTLQATALSIYGGIGIAQFGEYGAGIAAVGMERFRKSLITELKKADPHTVRQVSHLVAAVEGEERVFLEQYHYDTLRRDKSAQSEVGRIIDSALAAGQRAQGIITGYYWVRQNQQKVALRSMLHALLDTYEGVNPLSQARLVDIGMTPSTEAKIAKYFTGSTKVVERTAEGGINLHLDKWSGSDQMELAAILNRHIDQVVQSAYIGETSPWMHKMAGAVLMQGKGFAITSVSKQVLRNLKIQDEAAKMAVAWGFATGMAGYAAQQLLAGNLDELSPTDLVKGGVSNSNFTAWIPQFWDPLAAMTGMDALKISKFNQNARSDIVGAPPVFGVLNKYGHFPEAIGKAVIPGVDMDVSDISAMQALPLIGNLSYFRGFWNHLKENAKSAEKQERTKNTIDKQ